MRKGKLDVGDNVTSNSLEGIYQLYHIVVIIYKCTFTELETNMLLTFNILSLQVITAAKLYVYMHIEQLIGLMDTTMHRGVDSTNRYNHV